MAIPKEMDEADTEGEAHRGITMEAVQSIDAERRPAEVARECNDPAESAQVMRLI